MNQLREMSSKTTRKVNITIKRIPVEAESGSYTGIEYSFEAKVDLPEDYYELLENFIPEIQPDFIIEAEAREGAIFYDLKEFFGFDKLIEFNQEEYLEARCDKITQEIVNHLQKLRSVESIKELTSDMTYSEHREITF